MQKLQSFKMIITLIVIGLIFSSCKDDKSSGLASLEIRLSVNKDYDFIEIENTTVNISNNSGYSDEKILTVGNSILFENLPSGNYTIEASKHLTTEQKTALIEDPTKDVYIFATREIPIGSSPEVVINMQLHPNIEFIPSEVLVINEFIYSYMDLAYFWNKEMPFINYKIERDSEQYFYKLLKDPDDQWSFITDNITELENYFQGVTKSKGYSISPYYFKEGSNQVVVFVNYVYRDSPAEKAGLMRGDMFYKINGQLINDINFQALLSIDDVTLTMGQIIDGQIVELEPEITISAVENFRSHPVISTSIIETDDRKIGYLAYGSFINSYDTALVNTFEKFNEAGIDELILDLRYNGGGHVSSAVKLASMIGPATLANKTFIYEKWNDNLASQYDLNRKFQQEASNLNLNRLYVLTSKGTASASEMVIYGLAPYMEVVQVGERTHGKYYGSVTISDNNNPVLRKHSWAIQPIVMRAENVDNSIDYQVGLPPTYEIWDDLYAAHLFDEGAQLGDKEEFFVANVLSLIASGSLLTSDELKRSTIQYGVIDAYRDAASPFHGLMITDLPSELQ